MMIHKKKDSFEWLEFSLFQNYPEIRHGVLLHHDFASADKTTLISSVSSEFGFSSLFQAKQVHGSTVIVCDGPAEQIKEGDALCSQKKGEGLLIAHADCQAALFYDPIQKVVGAVHAGWRGNMQNIYLSFIQFLKNQYGCAPKNLLVGISPSLGPHHAQFIHYKEEFPKEFWKYRNENDLFNLWDIAKMQLTNAGIPSEQIEIAEICTYASSDYFSYRRDKTSKRHGSIIGLVSAPPHDQ